MDANTALILAESHLGTHDYAGNRPTLLVYLRGLLDATGTTSAKADAVRDWLNAIIFTAALQPDQIESVLTPPPYAFAEVAAEAASVLRVVLGVPSVTFEQASAEAVSTLNPES